MENEEYLQIIKELKQSVDVLLQGFYNLRGEINGAKNKKIDLTRQFSVLNLPSGGVSYENKNKSLLIKYITSSEEHILCDSLLMESGKGIQFILDSVVLDDDFDTKNILLGDLQSVLIFLRSTAYGDSIEFPITCPHCSKEGDGGFKLSEMKIKKPLKTPDDGGKYSLFFEDINKNVVISPITLLMEIEKNLSESVDDYYILNNNGEEPLKIRKQKTLSLAYNIESINGVTDKNIIKKHIRTLPKKHVDYLTQFIEDNSFGVDDKIPVVCDFCGKDFVQKIYIGHDFLKHSPTYKENIYEECFLLSYYGKGVTHQDAINMSVVERKWHIRRIKEEIDKKNEAEKQAMSRAKSKKR